MEDLPLVLNVFSGLIAIYFAVYSPRCSQHKPTRSQPPTKRPPRKELNLLKKTRAKG